MNFRYWLWDDDFAFWLPVHSIDANNVVVWVPILDPAEDLVDGVDEICLKKLRVYGIKMSKLQVTKMTSGAAWSTVLLERIWMRVVILRAEGISILISILIAFWPRSHPVPS
jgi:hypothetical protein